jgi:hypothetical protein
MRLFHPGWSSLVSSPKRPDRRWGSPSIIFNRFQGLVVWKESGRSLRLATYLSSADVKNGGMCVSTSIVYLHGVYKDIFIF